MNIVDKILLNLFLYLKPLYRKLGVNQSQLEAILMAKLTMDNRRPSMMRQMKQQKEKKEINKATLGTMFMSLFMGLFFLLSFTFASDLTSRLTVFFTLFVFMICILLITDFTSVLIDVRDNLIILPKPINDATFVTSRLLHIAIHIIKLVLPLSLPATIGLGIMYGGSILLPFMFMILFSIMFSIFIINATYILILKITSPTKFQNIINYIQIVFAVFIFAFYQLGPRLIQQYSLDNIKIESLTGIRFYPPFWFAETTNSFYNFAFNQESLISLVLSILVPIMSIFIVIKYLAPSFNRKLSMINSSAVEVKKAKTKTSSQQKSSLIERIAKLLTSNSQEYMGFIFSWKMMSRSREFKMKVYPSFGYMIVFFFMMAFNLVGKEEIQQGDFLTGNFKYIFILVLYFGSFMLMSAFSYITISEKFKASWIFHISPLDVPGKIISGTVKALIVFFYLPIYVVIGVLGIVFIGESVIPNLILGLLNMLVINSLMAYIFIRALPFSQSPENISKGKTFIRSLIVMTIPVGIGFAHYFVFDMIWAIVFFSILSAIALWMILDSIKKISWQKLGVESQTI